MAFVAWVISGTVEYSKVRRGVAGFDMTQTLGPGHRDRRTRRSYPVGVAAIVIPIGVLAALFMPLWMVGALIVIPLVIIGVMALAD